MLPGFRLTLGFTIFYLCLIVLVPLLTLPARTATMGWNAIWQTISDPRVVASYKLSVGAALAAAGVNAVFGLIVAWVLARYRFPGQAHRRRVHRSAVRAADGRRRHHVDDAVRAERLARGAARRVRHQGRVHAAWHHDRARVHRAAVRRAHAAAGHRGSRRRDRRSGDEPWREPRAYVLTRIILPYLYPAWLTGFALAFARAVGEYGSVVFISGNMPMRTEISPLLIITKLEQYDYAGATAIALVMLLISFTLLLTVNALQGWSSRKLAH